MVDKTAMSDNQQLEEVAGGEAPVTAEAKPKKTKGDKSPKQAKVGLLWFFVFITLLISGTAGYGVYLLSQQTDQAAISQGDLLEQSQTAIIDMRGDLSELERSLEGESAQRAADKEQASNSVELLKKSLAKQSRHIKELSASNRDQWLLAEVEYLLRLANQRILMSSDSAGALTMLDSADRILHGIDDVALHTVRKSIADDLASLRGVDVVDVDGIYLNLAALAEQVETLELYEIPEFDLSASESEVATQQNGVEQSVTEKLSLALDAASAALQKVFIIRRGNEQVEAMLAPQDELYLRQNLRLMLEQAQLALLSGQPAVYQKSLEKAQRWIAQYFLMENKSTQAALQGLNDLAALNIDPALPDISASFRALKKYQRGQLNARPGLDYQPAEEDGPKESKPEETAASVLPEDASTTVPAETNGGESLTEPAGKPAEEEAKIDLQPVVGQEAPAPEVSSPTDEAS